MHLGCLVIAKIVIGLVNTKITIIYHNYSLTFETSCNYYNFCKGTQPVLFYLASWPYDLANILTRIECFKSTHTTFFAESKFGLLGRDESADAIHNTRQNQIILLKQKVVK